MTKMFQFFSLVLPIAKLLVIVLNNHIQVQKYKDRNPLVINNQSTWLTNHIHREEGTVGITIELLITKKGTKLMTMTSLD